MPNSGSRPGGPLVRNARPQPSHISTYQRRAAAPSRDHASTNANIAAVSKNASSGSVETTLDATTGASDRAQTAAGSHGRDGQRRRPSPNTNRPVPMNASAEGRRAAHSLWPSRAKLAASAQ